MIFFTSLSEMRKEMRKQGTKYLSWCHTANESVYGSHASAAVLQCVGTKNDLVMFNRKIYIPFLMPLGLFLNGFLGNDFYLGWGGVWRTEVYKFHQKYYIYESLILDNIVRSIQCRLKVTPGWIIWWLALCLTVNFFWWLNYKSV